MWKNLGKRLLSIALAASLVNLGSPPWAVQAEEAVQGTVIDVTDYGADPSGKYDSTEAVMEALEEAKTIEGEKILNFPYGEYRFDKEHASTRVYHTSNTSSRSYPEKKIAILLEEVDNLTIEGNDSTLLVYGDIMALAVVESTNIKMQNLVLDYKDADTIDVSIVRTGIDEVTNKPYADIFIPEAYHYEISADKKHIQWQGEISEETGRPYWTWNDADFCAYLVVYKGYDRTVIRANNKEASNPFTGVENIAPSGTSTVRFTYESALPTDIVEGNIYQLSNSAWRQTAGAFFWESEDLMVENIDVHYLSGFGWLTQMCKDVEFKGVDFLPRDGSGKYTTSNADQLHVAGCGGYFKVTDCNFSMAHDDPINVHGTYMRVEEVIDERTVKVKYIHGQQGGFRQFHTGDEVLFYSRTFLEEPEGQVEEQPFIVASSIGPGEEYEGSTLDLVTEIVTFAEALPAETLTDLEATITKGSGDNRETQPLYVAENVTYTPEVTIKGNLMKSIPTRGILCTTRKPVIIEDNIFDNMAMANIYLSNDADYWYESGPIRNLTIRNNTFYIRPTGQAAVGTVSGIFIEPITVSASSGGEQKNPATLVHENITITENTFYLSNDNVVTANRVDGLTITNNTIIHEDDLVLSLDTKNELAIGKTQDIMVTVGETMLTKDVFQFNDCSNVTVSGNTYDEGMNLNIRLDSRMSADDLTLGETEQEVLTVNGGSNRVTSASKVQLVSSTPEVAYIDEAGKLVGVKAGTTTVQAYIEKNGALIRSNPVQVTVGEGAGRTFTLTAADTFFENKDETTQLTIPTGTTATYQLLDPLTGKTSDKGRISGNTYTAKKDGAVLLKATAANGETDQLLMVNSFGVSYNTASTLAQGVNVLESTEGGVLALWEDTVQITPQSNGNGIYTSSRLVNNIVNLDIPEEMKNDLILHIDAQGLVEKGSGYNSSGVMLFEDLDNYLFVGKRNHFSGVSTMLEIAENCTEAAGNASDNSLTATTFEFVISNGRAVVSYLDDNGSWQRGGEFAVSHLQDGAMKLGLVSWLNGGASFAPVYSNIRMAKASETSREELKELASQTLFTSVENERPAVTSAIIQGTDLKVGTAVTVNAQAADTDGNISSYLYQWTLEAADGTVETAYTRQASYVPAKEGSLSVAVIAYDQHHKPSQLFTSEEKKTVATATQTDQALDKLYVNGYAVEGLTAGSTHQVYIPDDVEKIRISYGKADANIETVITGNETVSIAVGSNSAVVAVADTYTITRGTLTYTLKVSRVGSSDNAVISLSVGGQAVNLQEEIQEGTDSWFVHVEDNTDVLPLVIETSPGSVLRVTRSYFEHEVANVDTNRVETDITMTAGINAYYIYITAADGISTREAKLYLYADGYADSELTGITVNGAAIEGFDPSIEEYTVHVTAQQAENLQITTSSKEGQQTSITYAGKRVEGNQAAFALTDNLNKIVVANVAKNMWSKHFYTLNVIIDSENNADLLTLTTDSGFGSAFTPDTNEYTLGMNTVGKLQVTATAQMPEAGIRMSLAGGVQRTERAKGSLTHEFTLYEGENRIIVEVTSADGNTVNTYVLEVPAKGLVYASDVIAENTKEGITSTTVQVGYGTIQLDCNVNGSSKISLPDENGNKVVFDKGIGAHAASTIVYTLEEGHRFTAFQAYTGIDYVQYNTNQSSVSFQVWVDGVKQWDSEAVLGEVTGAKTPMQFVSVDVTGAGEIKLIVDAEGSNGYDHSEWADACFIRGLEANTALAVDKTGLAATVADAEALKKEDYTTDSWKVLETSLQEARKILANDIYTQAETEAADNALKAAQKALKTEEAVAPTVDKTQLKELVSRAETAIASGKYTDASAQKLQTEVAKAKAVLQAASATQAQVNQAVSKLNQAMGELEEKPAEIPVVDKSQMTILITQAETAIASGKYTDASAQKLQTEVAKAKAVLQAASATQAQVNQAVSKLNQVMGELEEKPAEKKFPFTDVPVISGNWKYDSVKYVYDKGIMNGISGTTLFQPDHPLTRAMFATVLYRMAGEPAVTFESKFSDVKDGTWYSKAIIWANQQRIVDGFQDGSYGINTNITREQIAKMLYEYAKVCKYDISAKKELNTFTDAKSVSGWAVDYMKWATAVEMITGKPNEDKTYRLDPKGEATRAECAAMLTRFQNKYK
ncbi:MAG: NPCBM/NEW2 domain-containing protein [Lachnospiraceae bacterium]|nr:NPCBM/NEW2 domain-containing protein [Lachnospiraceae bacterium]